MPDSHTCVTGAELLAGKRPPMRFKMRLNIKPGAAPEGRAETRFETLLRPHQGRLLRAFERDAGLRQELLTNPVSALARAGVKLPAAALRNARARPRDRRAHGDAGAGRRPPGAERRRQPAPAGPGVRRAGRGTHHQYLRLRPVLQLTLEPSTMASRSCRGAADARAGEGR